MTNRRDAAASSEEFQEITRELAAAVTEAGGIALRMFRDGCRSWTKDGHSPVTEADIAVNEMLLQRLRAFSPDAGWLSEETADAPERLQRRTVWVVDPIDGTRSFVNKQPDWSISAAYVMEGRPAAAALFAPVSGELFLATRGQGANLNGARIAANLRSDLSGAHIGAPKSRVRHLEKAGIKPGETVPIYSLALRFARVASGKLDAALASANSHDWDLAAADLIVHEARGMLTTIHGDVPVYNRSSTEHIELVAAGPQLHPVLLAALAPGAGGK